jgi:beta-galactosidase
MKNTAGYNGKSYDVVHVCDILHSQGASVLGEYKTDFYKGTPAVTVNNYGKGRAYYVAFRNDDDFATDFCDDLIKEMSISSDTGINAEPGVSIRKRGNVIFVMNFSDEQRTVTLDKQYKNVVTGEAVDGKITLNVCGYIILEA